LATQVAFGTDDGTAIMRGLLASFDLRPKFPPACAESLGLYL
jgi:hypothetical protein